MVSHGRWHIQLIFVQEDFVSEFESWRIFTLGCLWTACIVIVCAISVYLSLCLPVLTSQWVMLYMPKYLCIWLYPPLQRSWKGGILVSPCPSVRLSVCGQNRVRSVSSTILIGSISYLHILSSNFRRCVACNARFKIQKFESLAIFLNL